MTPREARAIVETIARAKTEITADIASGVIPDSPFVLVGFSELHDFVDANTYGGLCDDDWYKDVFTFDDKGYAHARFVQDRLDEWIRAGFPKASTYPLHD